MLRPLIVATLIMSALTTLGEIPAAEVQNKPLPVVTRSAGEVQRRVLPVVRRSDKKPATPFDIPALIVMGRVFEERTIVAVAEGQQRIDNVGDPHTPPELERLYRLSLAVLRVNERLPSDPDLAERYDFLLRQRPGAELKLEFGKNYILFVELAKPVRGLQWGKPEADPIPYVIALPDAGFEFVGEKVDSATVRVLRRGGVLTPYDGKPLNDVFRLITGQTFLSSIHTSPGGQSLVKACWCCGLGSCKRLYAARRSDRQTLEIARVTNANPDAKLHANPASNGRTFRCLRTRSIPPHSA